MKTYFTYQPGQSQAEVYILPLRNENLRPDQLLSNQLSCLYPTFKEWKPSSSFTSKYTLLCLYPTFKEWKHTLTFVVPWYSPCLYPTFKEWKLQR